jgi:hypothetical protein
VVERLSSTCKALDSITSILPTKKKKKRVGTTFASEHPCALHWERRDIKEMGFCPGGAPCRKEGNLNPQLHCKR